MSNAHGLTKENLLFTFPLALRENPSIAALADVTMEALAKRPAEIALLSLYPRIDELPEALLDILAYDFKVDWWDVNYSLEEKRRTLKDSWRVHKMLGTKAAVETAISAIYPHTRVLEWFEYGGAPGLTETIHAALEIPVPLVRLAASARAGTAAGLWESAAVRIELDAPALRRRAAARVGASAGTQEIFTASVILPDTDPPAGAAQFKAAVSSARQEHYTTREIRLETQAPTVSTQASARGAVAARQETAQTTINFNRR